MKHYVHIYRFELLLIVLILVIFNKIFVESPQFYSKVIWPINMLLLGVVTLGMFHDHKSKTRWLKNLLFLMVVAVPFFTSFIFTHYALTLLALLAYISFYTIIFIELMRQVIQKTEVTASIIMGSLSGFLLIIIVSSFSYLLIDCIEINAFNNLKGTSIPEKYHQVMYFSSITLSTIGYGDITPATDNARLLSAFWGIIGQFYMVAVVGIIISKFTSK